MRNTRPFGATIATQQEIPPTFAPNFSTRTSATCDCQNSHHEPTINTLVIRIYPATDPHLLPATDGTQKQQNRTFRTLMTLSGDNDSSHSSRAHASNQLNLMRHVVDLFVQRRCSIHRDIVQMEGMHNSLHCRKSSHPYARSLPRNLTA